MMLERGLRMFGSSRSGHQDFLQTVELLDRFMRSLVIILKTWWAHAAGYRVTRANAEFTDTGTEKHRKELYRLLAIAYEKTIINSTRRY